MTTSTSTFPCIDCVTYPICRAKYKELFRHHYSIEMKGKPKASELSTPYTLARIISRSWLARKCCIIKEYLHYPPNVIGKAGILDMKKVNELHEYYGEST